MLRLLRSEMNNATYLQVQETCRSICVSKTDIRWAGCGQTQAFTVSFYGAGPFIFSKLFVTFCTLFQRFCITFFRCWRFYCRLCSIKDSDQWWYSHALRENIFVQGIFFLRFFSPQHDDVSFLAVVEFMWLFLFWNIQKWKFFVLLDYLLRWKYFLSGFLFRFHRKLTWFYYEKMCIQRLKYFCALIQKWTNWYVLRCKRISLSKYVMCGFDWFLKSTVYVLVNVLQTVQNHWR